ncbi:MAG: serine protease [Terriglobia bacterium]
MPFPLCLFTSSFFLSLLAGEHSPSGLPRANVEASVVQLLAIGPGSGDKNHTCAATGFMVNEDGVILTNAHVVEDARRCLAASPTGKIVAKFPAPGKRTATAVSCDVVALDDLHDLALLKPERPIERAHAHAALDVREPAAGTAVSVTGHSASAWQPITQKGTILRRGQLPLADNDPEKTEVLILDIPLQRGASGSPVYLDSGAVVGIVSRQNPSRPSETVAVPIRYAIDLLDLQGLRWHGRR